ncbi:MAG: DUF6377 domain-containing protein [Dysgonomonas sp.]
MKKTTLFFLIIISSFVSIFGQKKDLAEELRILDQELKNRDQYALQKEARINQLKEKRLLNITTHEEYLINIDIIDEYATYLCDSAMIYAEQNLLLAEKLENKKYKSESQIKLAKIYALAGLFFESAQLLDAIVPNHLPKDLRKEYYVSYYMFYNTLIKYTNDNKYSSKYQEKMITYVDSARSLVEVNSERNVIEDIYIDFFKNNTALAIKRLSLMIPQVDPESHNYALATSCLAYSYMKQEVEPEQQRIYLAKAAITDTKLVIKDHSALLSLAILLNKDNDIERAYKYMKIAQEDANFFNSRHRHITIAKLFPIIEKTYQSKIENQKKDLTFYLILVTILAVGLLLTSIYIYKQVRIVTKARRNLKQLNQKLDEANHIKEEYIGYFLNQCSIYINKLDEYKQQMYRKIKSGQIDDLVKSVSINNKKKDIKDLYTSFDIAFLKLYPSFVNDFNHLLKENEQYRVKSNELNTELRIFALIRLGITDSKQISSFLRYSTQTIYNYRSKVRSKAINEGEDFEEKIKNIGLL